MGLGAPELILIIAGILLTILPAALGYRAGADRSVGPIGGLLIGFLFSFIGVIVIYLMPKNTDPQLYNFNNYAPSAADELQKFKQLLDNGAITEAEYQTQKEKILRKY